MGPYLRLTDASGHWKRDKRRVPGQVQIENTFRPRAHFCPTQQLLGELPAVPTAFFFFKQNYLWG